MFEKEIIKLIKKETHLKEVRLEIPPHPDQGDYAFPCFQLAKEQHKSPLEIALELSHKIKPNEFIASVVPKGPYLNFFVNREKLSELTIKSILRMKEKYGSSFQGRDQKVLIEHTSINPNAEPHVGRARNAIIGDAVVRLLRFQGYDTEVHYFVNDIGKQIAILVLGAGSKTPSFESLIKYYIKASKEVKESKKKEEQVFKLLYDLENGNKEARRKFKKIVDISVKGQKQILAQLGIKYDVYDYESRYLFDNTTKEVLKRLEKTRRLFTDEHGRKVLDLQGFNIAMEQPVLVLTRNDGTSVYSLRDLAYNLDKVKKGYARNILILGEDQKMYAQQMEASLSLLKVKGPEVVHYSFITLAGIGKMSTRSGDVVMLKEFMEEAIKKSETELKERGVKGKSQLASVIGLGAVKYAILRVSPDKNVVFDWASALAFEGESSPYIQYAHARACSILRQSKVKIDAEKINFKVAAAPEEIALINKLYQFPEIAQKATDQLRPHLIATYTYQLAKSFSDFYHACPVLTSAEETKLLRVSIVAASKQVLETSLGLLGITAPPKM